MTAPARTLAGPGTGTVAAVAAAVSGVAHLPLAAEHAATAPVAALVLLLLSAGCLHCAAGLRAGPSRSTWLLAGAMATLMLVLHAPGSPLAHPHPGTSLLLPAVAGVAELVLLVLAARALRR